MRGEKINHFGLNFLEKQLNTKIENATFFGGGASTKHSIFKTIFRLETKKQLKYMAQRLSSLFIVL